MVAREMRRQADLPQTSSEQRCGSDGTHPFARTQQCGNPADVRRCIEAAPAAGGAAALGSCIHFIFTDSCLYL
jgi:hypothetical protein